MQSHDIFVQTHEERTYALIYALTIDKEYFENRQSNPRLVLLNFVVYLNVCYIY